jgi:hypothetical protein
MGVPPFLIRSLRRRFLSSRARSSPALYRPVDACGSVRLGSEGAREIGDSSGQEPGDRCDDLGNKPSLRSIVRRDTGEGFEEFLRRLAQASGIETPSLAARDRRMIRRRRRQAKTSETPGKPGNRPHARRSHAPSQCPRSNRSKGGVPRVESGGYAGKFGRLMRMLLRNLWRNPRCKEQVSACLLAHLVDRGGRSRR